MVFRTIQPLANAPAPSVERGPVPEQRWLPIADLRVDETYQRPIQAAGAKTIRGIVAAFDWRLFAPVVVCPVEGGVYAIVDGQHRVTAALTCGVTDLPCHVIQADRVMQAKSFGAINGCVTQMTGAALYKARLLAGDPMARRMDACARAAGLTIMTYKPNWLSLKPGQTTANVAIEAALRVHPDARVTRALAALVRGAGDATGVITSITVGAFVEVIAGRDEWRDRADIADICEMFDVATAIDETADEAARRRVPKRPLLEARLVTFLSRQDAEGARPERARAVAA